MKNNLLGIFIATSLMLAAIPIASAQTAPPILNISNKYDDGAGLSGMWTVLRQGTTTAATGYSPVNFNLNSGQTYTVTPSNYQDITFHHWLDTNSTMATRTVSITQNTNLVAVYVSNSHPMPSNNLPPPTQVTINVNSITTNGTSVSGVYTVIKDNNGVVMLAVNTPMSFTATTGQTYTIQISPYEIFNTGSYTFTSWSDGVTGSVRTITPTQAATVTAIYRNNPQGLKTISVGTANVNGESISGLFLNISPTPRGVISSQYSPASWTLEADTAYTVTPQDYGSYFFDHWNDGNVTRSRVFYPTAGLNITAYFSTSNDHIPPLVTIISPLPNAIRTSSQVTLSGTASDNVGVMRIEASVDGQPFVKADGLVKWSYMASNLVNGTHTATIRASDLAGNTGNATTTFVVGINPILPKTGVYIPMYFKPTSDTLQQLATVRAEHPSVPIVAAINPSSGPGNTFDPVWNSSINSLSASGVTVIGYTPTKYGARNIDSVKADIDKYLTWYPATQGLMLDEFANSAGYESYYVNITSYAKSHGLKLVMGNAGADPPQSYVGTVDAIGITEGDGYPPAAWLKYCVGCSVDGSSINSYHYKYDKNNFKFSRYAIDNLDPNFVHEASKWVGLFYVTNGVSPTRWNFLPPYFENLVGLLDNQ